MNTLSKAKGFTLIELVVVIVVLGILAATAAPKFIDLTSDARKAILQGVSASINTAADLTLAKSLVEGRMYASTFIDIPSVGQISTTYGWPKATSISRLVTYDTDDIFATASGSATVFKHLDATNQDQCYVSYDTSAVTGIGRRPSITINEDGC